MENGFPQFPEAAVLRGAEDLWGLAPGIRAHSTADDHYSDPTGVHNKPGGIL